MIAPEVAGSVRAGLHLNEAKTAFPATLAEDEEVLGNLPEEEPVRTGWSSFSYAQPAGYSSSEITIYSRGSYGAACLQESPSSFPRRRPLPHPCPNAALVWRHFLHPESTYPRHIGML